MINIEVYSHTNIDIEDKSYSITNQGDMIVFLKDLLDKVYYGGETICLESIRIDNEKGKSIFTEIGRWK